MRVRFSTYELAPTQIDNKTLEITAPKVALPGATVVQVSFNGQ